jgi:surface antigen
VSTLKEQWRRLLVGAVIVILAFSGALAVPVQASATIGNNDYPSNLANSPKDSVIDPWRFYNRECVSFVAWRLNNDNGFGFSNFMNGGHFGNAVNWKQNAINLFGSSVYNSSPSAGSVAWWNANYHGALSDGHVAYVDSVNPNGSITIEEYNAYPNVGGYTKSTLSPGSGRWPSGFLHFKDMSNVPSGPITQDSFQSDTKGDLAVLHQTESSGFDAHVLYGSTGTPFQHNPTYANGYPASNGWDWTQIKTSSGDYNGDSYSDIAVVHQLPDGGADIHVLWGGDGVPFAYAGTLVRNLPASAGWDWSKMKLESGKFQKDRFSDLAILHQRDDGGFDAHVLYGSTGTPFQHNPTLASSFTGVGGGNWDWSKIKISANDFNGDLYDDIAIAHQRGDAGADISMLWGLDGIPFTATTSPVRQLAGTAGWDWSKMKLESGKFQKDPYGDLAILHQRSDGGFDAHVLYGSTGTPFQYSPTLASSFTGVGGGNWDWSKIKTSSGDYNGDSYGDIAVVHQLPDGGADTHMLWGGEGIPFIHPTTFVRHLSVTNGWEWSKMILTSS